MSSTPQGSRAQWNSRTGFILAAAGSAVGLGNIWRFPYITGENGGGAFVLVYLLCILLVGVPVMIAEIMLGRTARSSPVNAFRSLSSRREPWVGVGILGVLAGFVLLSYYSTVAAWAVHFTYLSLTDSIAGGSADAIRGLFDQLTGNVALGVGWQLGFLALTVGVVSAGVTSGIERCSKVMMPALFVLLVVLMANSFTLDGWNEGMEFLFGMRLESLTAQSVLEALGQGFFTLSLGMGAMITYGSYLSSKDDLTTASLATAGTDTLVAIMASLVLFPIVFTFGLEPGQGPDLLFVTLPTALAQMTGGAILSVLFFVMLVFAALTSAIAMFEVAAAYLKEEFGATRKKACLIAAAAVAAIGIPATASSQWFGVADNIVSNWLLPLGGLGVALFVAWRMDAALRRGEFEAGSRLAGFYRTWLWILKYPVPVCIVLVFLSAVGVL